jgi:hypothetical protein
MELIMKSLLLLARMIYLVDLQNIPLNLDKNIACLNEIYWVFVSIVRQFNQDL